MSYFTGKHLNTVVQVIGSEFPAGPMDCEDVDDIHLWITVPAISSRRAFLVQGTPFVTAFLQHNRETQGYINMLFDPYRIGCVEASLRGWVDKVRGRRFIVDMEGPEDEASAGERIRIWDIRVATVGAELAAKFGMEPDDGMVKEKP